MKGRLFVYDKSLRAVIACEGVARAIAPSRADLADQLRRASCSISLNIAEGAGEFSPREKMRFYRMARRSAFESQAALDIVDLVVHSAPDTTVARGALEEVLALLTRTSAAVEASPSPPR